MNMKISSFLQRFRTALCAWLSGFATLFLFVSSLTAQEEVAFLSTNSTSSDYLTAEETTTLSLPFELVSNLMWFEAEIDGQSGNFILDTGVPTLVLHQEVSPINSQTMGYGASGQETPLSEGAISSFQLAGVELGEQRSLGLDLSGLSHRSERNLMGIMGHEQLRDYELLIDYEAGTFYLLPARKNDLHEQTSPAFSLPFSYLEHLPIVRLKQADQSLYFAIDTGAGSNLIDPEVFTEGVRAAPTGSHTIVRGLDGGQLEQANYELSGLHHRQQQFPDQDFVSVPLRQLAQEGQRIDGILGQPFLQQYRISIDFKRQKIHFWD
ncbi:MAG: hypothetical protein AAF433_20520 [Bacteroidota bacterium]